ncbi:hypothetical protein TWF102_009914 [Orbilia oligospora]|uniref:SWIRM domain-containing protein n=1 Tax=Orbilia oligospora TaxID=2813651 RepID=A0A7C8JFM0_ORBOL|nr:hypothetical protein TWF103_002261 [Orbilia oligospora]KAF3085050.1 hypothetical protein TWF103_002261 [Orbilia oligospora]KAF3109137.1 hypothetical protein TWF102_009914 [Orbilia oligospora]
MVLDYRPIGARNSSGSRFSHGFFTPEEKHSKPDYIGAFADGLIGRRDRRATKDDMCINLSSSQFGAARIIIEDDGSTCSRSSSRTGDSERTSHTSSSIEQELPGGTYSPPVTVHRGRTASYLTPQPMSKPQTPIRNVKMQRFPSLSGVDLTNLPPTPDSLRATPLFGSGLDMNKRRREPSPEIPSAEDIESEAEVDHHSNLEGEEEDGLEGDEWEDVEEDEDGETDDGDSVRYETASDDYEDDMEDNNFIIGEEDGDDDDYDIGEEEEERELQGREGDRQLHLDEAIPPYNTNTDEDLDEDGAYTPKLRAKLEASPHISPIIEPATTLPSPPPPPTNTPLSITNLPPPLLSSTEPPLLVNRTFKLTSHLFSRPSSSSISHPPSSTSSSSFSSFSSANQPASFSEDLLSTSTASYASGLSKSDSLPVTSVSSSSSTVVHLLSDFIGNFPASSPSSTLSIDNPLDPASNHLSSLPINCPSNTSSEHCSGLSVSSPVTSLSHGLPRPPFNSPTALSSLEPLEKMPPYIQIKKTDKELSLSSSMERQNPKKRAMPQARSCIPENPAEFRDYAQECVWAADAARLNPWNLHEGEYEVLRDHLNQLHVTTYLNVRNGILRLWLKNSKKRVTVGEAMGCCKEERFFGLAEVAFNWLTRSGYINHGCLEMPIGSSAKKPGTRRRKTIAIIGAGISGLAAARQLEALLASSGECLGGSGVPDVVVFEGRHRLGGRVFSATLTPGPHNLPDGLEPAVDIGGQIVMGYDARNPLAALIVDQLGIPFHTIGRVFPIHDHDGKVIGDGRDTVIELVHNDILRRLSKFSYKEPPPQTAHGDVEYITKCKDPWGVGGPPLAEVQGEGHVAPPIPLAERGREKKEARKLRKALEGLNIKVVKAYNEDGLACLGKTMEKVLPGYANLLKTDARDLRLFNWFQANLEYGNAVEVNGSSLEHWDQDDGNEPAGAHTMIMGGYSELAKGLSSTPSELDVRLNHVVTRIKYDLKNSEKKVALQFADGQTFEADKVIVTLPLGVLKREHGVDFVPPLPEAKQDAIKRLGFGLLNKVIMVYEEAFWDTNNAGFGCLRKAEEGQDEDLFSSYEKKRGRFYIWWNTTDAVGRPTLVGLMVGDAAEQVEGEDPEEIIKEATGILKKCWGEDKVPDRPEEIFVTKWRKDPFALGSYSYVAPGSTGADYDTIAKPINDQIFFAGEHTSRKYPATVHGAYISGLRVAGEVAEAMLGPIQVPTPLIGPRVMKSRTEAVVETTTIRTSSVAGARVTKSTNIQITKTTKDQRATIASRRSTISTVVQQKTKRKASDEDEYRGLAKRARTNSSRAETSQQKRKRQVAYEPEPEARPIKKPRVPSVQAGPQQICVPTDPKPEEPRKETANPFLIYQKDFFKIAQNRANHAKREQTGTADAKADRNEVRVVLGDMWKSAAPETKNRYQDQANQNKRDNLAKINDHKRQVVAWELRQVTNTRATVAPAPISSSPAPISSAVYPTPADTTPSVDDRETIS